MRCRERLKNYYHDFGEVLSLLEGIATLFYKEFMKPISW